MNYFKIGGDSLRVCVHAQPVRYDCKKIMFTSNWVRSGFRVETINALIVLICLTGCIPSSFVSAQPPSKASQTAEVGLKSYLQSYLGKPESKEDENAQYLVAWVDLNDDGKREAVVYVYGPGWCGSGGCVTLVLAPDGTTYTLVTKMTITRLPIRIMPEKSHGWHDISVTVGGGGIPAHEARMRFNGEAYPSNPSVAPAQPIKGKTQGRIIISPSDKGDQFVYR